MNRECGNLNSKIWLIADSEPSRFRNELQDPLDLKHPTVHNIFTPILEQIQDELFNIGNRINRNKLYIRNALINNEDWKSREILDREIDRFKNLVEDNSPIIILSFGGRAFEFVRRALGEEKRLKSWNTKEMGYEFAKRCGEFNVNEINSVPLLHSCIARGKFLKAHSNYCVAIREKFELVEENYFIAAGKIISKIIIENKRYLDCFNTLDNYV